MRELRERGYNSSYWNPTDGYDHNRRESARCGDSRHQPAMWLVATI